MEKTSVYLSDAERERLGHLAAVTGRSQSAIIREAIASYQPAAAGGRDLALTGVADGPAGSIADLPDEELLDGFGG
ncbi:MAG: CopG family transcriptional regulator [Egibacteraceae bacterium]